MRPDPTTRAPAGPSLTIALPIDALGPVTLTAPAPALVSRVNASHVGLEPDELVRVLRAMRADPRFMDDVVARGKSFRAAPPDAIVAFLRSAPVAAEEESEVDAELLHEAGYAAPKQAPKAPASAPRLIGGGR